MCVCEASALTPDYYYYYYFTDRRKKFFFINSQTRNGFADKMTADDDVDDVDDEDN